MKRQLNYAHIFSTWNELTQTIPVGTSLLAAATVSLTDSSHQNLPQFSNSLSLLLKQASWGRRSRLLLFIFSPLKIITSSVAPLVKLFSSASSPKKYFALSDFYPLSQLTQPLSHRFSALTFFTISPSLTHFRSYFRLFSWRLRFFSHSPLCKLCLDHLQFSASVNPPS